MSSLFSFIQNYDISNKRIKYFQDCLVAIKKITNLEIILKEQNDATVFFNEKYNVELIEFRFLNRD